MSTKNLVLIIATGGIAYLVWRLTKKPTDLIPPAAAFGIGDVPWCDAAGDPGYFTIVDREYRTIENSWYYRVGEGLPPPIEDLGWWSEGALLSSPWSCSII